jgi:hypothetical protein
MMNRMNSGSIISSPATMSDRMRIVPTAYRCGQSRRTYSRRYSRRRPRGSGAGVPPSPFGGPSGRSSPWSGFAGSSRPRL